MCSSKLSQSTETGAVLTEAAVLVVILSCLLLTGIDVLHLSYKHMLGQWAVSKAAQWASYGVTLPESDSRRESIKQTLLATSRQYGLTFRDVEIQLCSLRDETCGQSDDLVAGERYRIVVDHNYRHKTAFFGTLDFDFRYIGLAINEHF